jgi:hypothetical protein
MMTITVGKLNGQLVQVVKVVESVQFSSAPNWVLICTDFQQPERNKQHFKWVPASTRFEWVRTFAF